MTRSSRYFAQGDVFKAFYEDNYEDLLRFFARQVYDAQLATDLCAETFARAFVARKRPQTTNCVALHCDYARRLFGCMTG